MSEKVNNANIICKRHLKWVYRRKIIVNVILLFELRYHCDLSGSASLAQAIDQYIMTTSVLLPLLYS